MVYWIRRREAVSSETARAEGNPPRGTQPPSRASRLEMLAAAGQGPGECPAWIVVEFEARETTGRKMAFGKGGKR